MNFWEVGGLVVAVVVLILALDPAVRTAIRHSVSERRQYLRLTLFH